MKAKAAIDSSSLKQKQAMEQLAQCEAKAKDATERNKDLMQTLEIFQQKRNGIKTEDVKRIAARIKVNDIAFSLIETKDFEMDWYKESQLLNL